MMFTRNVSLASNRRSGKAIYLEGTYIDARFSDETIRLDRNVPVSMLVPNTHRYWRLFAKVHRSARTYCAIASRVAASPSLLPVPSPSDISIQRHFVTIVSTRGRVRNDGRRGSELVVRSLTIDWWNQQTRTLNCDGLDSNDIPQTPSTHLSDLSISL